MSGRIWIGLLFLFIGFGILLNQLDILNFFDILSAWWPLILIVIGAVQLTNRSISPVSGILFIVVGLIFLAGTWLNFNIYTLIWPIILIAIGLSFLLTRTKRDRPINTDKGIKVVAIFSGADVYSQAQDFEGGSVTAIFGGVEVDLRDVTIAEEGATLDLTAAFGGISIMVPKNIRIEETGLPLFGGWENKAFPRVDADEENLPLLRINYLAAFGGVEIKN